MKGLGPPEFTNFRYRIAVGLSSICYGISCDLLVKIVTERREELLATEENKKAVL